MHNTNILIIGKNGFLGSTLTRLLKGECSNLTALDRDDLDLTKPLDKTTLTKLKIFKPNYVILCASMVGIDDCRSNIESSSMINVHNTIQIIYWSWEVGAIPVFFSSDYVFSDGNLPYKESDQRTPVTIYGEQKKAVEEVLIDSNKPFLVFRSNKLISLEKNPKNLLYSIILSLKNKKEILCFTDQFVNPVFTEDVALILKECIKQNITGVFHLGTKKIYSRFELGKMIAEELNLDGTLVKEFSKDNLNLLEPRPRNCALNCNKIRSVLGIEFREVKEQLALFS